MKKYPQLVLITVISFIISFYLSKRRTNMSIVVRSACFDHQISNFLEVDGVNNSNWRRRGKGLYAIVIKKIMGKVYTKSFHVGVLKMESFESRLKDMHSFISSEKKKGGSKLVIFSIGTSHEKGVVDEMKDGLISGEYVEVADILRLYGMKKFLSVAHGCRQPYTLVHDLTLSNTLSERTGACGGTLCSKA